MIQGVAVEISSIVNSNDSSLCAGKGQQNAESLQKDKD